MASEIYKATIVGAISGMLSPAGFKKHGMHFRRPVNDLVHVISLQSSAGSTNLELKITLNIGIWLPQLAEGQQEPDTSSLHLRERIGFLMPEHRDHWWKVPSEPDAILAADQICEMIQGFVLPYLKKLETSGSLAKLWRSGTSPGLTEFQRQRLLRKLTSSN